MTGSRAGQAAEVGGPQAGVNRVIHWCSRCQPPGRWSMMCPRPDRAMRAATLIRSRRSVAPRAFAYARLARAPAARSRLCAMGGAGRPRGIGGERARWHMRERPAGDVGEDLLHDRVIPVLALGLDAARTRESVNSAW